MVEIDKYKEVPAIQKEFHIMNGLTNFQLIEHQKSQMRSNIVFFNFHINDINNNIKRYKE